MQYKCYFFFLVHFRSMQVICQPSLSLNLSLPKALSCLCFSMFFFLLSLASFLTCHSHLTHRVLLGYFSFKFILKTYSSHALLALKHSVIFLTYLSRHFIFNLSLIILFPIVILLWFFPLFLKISCEV